MKWLRFLLFPFGFLYLVVTSIRNFLYDQNILKSYVAPVPVIAVGNLSTGGTGKSPQIEYLIRLLSDTHNIAALSRGYKRESQGFVLADKNTSVEEVGDEPFQFFSKFPAIRVAVDANRVNGIKQLLSLEDSPEVILLDDAYQHRKVRASLYILLTTYSDLYSDDFILPVGNLRESKSGAKRAKIVVVTKCPPTLSENEKQTIKNKLALKDHQKLFFATIGYDHQVFSKETQLNIQDVKRTEKVMLAGIAKPEPFFNFLKNEKDILLKYPDHHNFSDIEIEAIKTKSGSKIIVTTEKDYVRIKDKFDTHQLFYLPIKTRFLGEEKIFQELIRQAIKESNL